MRVVTTIFDVAREAGVSTSTVSLVMNGNARVDPQLAAKVARVARKLNYRPNQTARVLRLRQSRVWALVISGSPGQGRSSPTSSVASRTSPMKPTTPCSCVTPTRIP